MAQKYIDLLRTHIECVVQEEIEGIYFLEEPSFSAITPNIIELESVAIQLDFSNKKSLSIGWTQYSAIDGLDLSLLPTRLGGGSENMILKPLWSFLNGKKLISYEFFFEKLNGPRLKVLVPMILKLTFENDHSVFVFCATLEEIAEAECGLFWGSGLVIFNGHQEVEKHDILKKLPELGYTFEKLEPIRINVQPSEHD